MLGRVGEVVCLVLAVVFIGLAVGTAVLSETYWLAATFLLIGAVCGFSTWYFTRRE